MYKKIIWKLILFLSIISAIVFSVSVIISGKITNGTNKEETSVKNNQPESNNESTFSDTGDAFNILVLGDSLAKGTGDETGAGFAQEFAKAWSAQNNKKVETSNMAINGDVSSGLLTVVQKEEILKSVELSNLIFISIGGNEVKAFQSNIKDANAADVKIVQDKYLSNLKEIMNLIQSKNKKCKIVFIGLYNPFGEEISQENLKTLYEWNFKTEELLSLYPNTVFIPTYDLFKYNLDNYLAQDKFHPNSKGYKAISNRILEVIK
ncbi:GDSL-type esterase/lipase family protein [Clostridium sp. C2-6-12]|uniref:GDSL-type esterase/lipase family protein n=1 Tax=Clostridium sp. C2-6-12 TaxID=2698832 RepID=UPI00136E273C|nr:GDSL-type esterase/lipase family protein [Clostridium sp. C2-6-12]